MRKLLILTVLFSAGCTAVTSPIQGSLFTNTKGPLTIGTGDMNAQKMGTSFSYGVYIPYIGSFAWGDASLETAKRNAQIKEVAYADTESFSLLLGLFSKFETHVYGN